MCSVQYGASLAKGLFPLLGPAGATVLRVALAALLLGMAYRPWRGALPAGTRRSIVGYGVALGFMNLCYYLALARAPMGVVVALEFTGPLAVALLASRRPMDFLWVLLAVSGLLLLVPWRGTAANVDPVGLGLALLSGVCWALYIVFGTRAGAAHGGRGVALGMVVATLVVLPAGFGTPPAAFLDPRILGIGVVVALLCSALPYVLEIHAMQALPTRTFGIFMSLEPAIAALSGFVFLDERLESLQLAAIGCVVAASLGSAATSRTGPHP